MMHLRRFSTVLCAAAVGLSIYASAQPVSSQPISKAPAVSRHKAAPLSRQERVIHALNRFTFGPGPGDMERVEALGLDKWLDQQLHPEKIDDSALEARLNQFPAMRLSSAALLQKFPPRPLIEQVDAGRLAIPGDPVERAIYADALERFRTQREQKQVRQANVKQDANANAMTATQPAKDSMNNGMSMQAADSHKYEQEAKRLLAMNPVQRWPAILAEQPGELGSVVRSMKRQDREALVTGFTPVQQEAVTAMVDVNRVIAGELMEEKLVRAIYSDRQLNEVMTDFWFNHFNVYLRKDGEMPWLLATYERDIIRPHALGNFEQLLDAVAHSPAMLVYLDNQQSIGPDSLAAGRAAVRKGNAVAPGLNENYARELMELHTLGVNGGYTQHDVTEVAKVFTGWGVVSPKDGYGYRFENRRHEPGTKVVLGRRISEGGEQEGLEVLHMLAENPATARFISTKLATRFVSDNPPPALIDKMSKKYLKTHGDIRQVLHEMLKSRDFWSPDAYRAKVKTPLEFVASAARATNAVVVNAASLVQALDRLGMPMYGVQQPNGYSLKADPWLGSEDLVMRFNFALGLTANKLPGVAVTLPPPAGSDEDQEAGLEQLLLEGQAAGQTHAAVMTQMEAAQVPGEATATVSMTRERGGKEQPRPDLFAPALPAKSRIEEDARIVTAAALLLGSPEFQRH